MFYNPQPSSHLHVAIPKTIQSRRCRIPNLLAADVDAHRGRVLRLRLVHRQQAHTSAHVQTPPPTLKMLWSYFILFHDWVVGYSSSVLKLYQFMNCPKTSHPDLPKLYQWPMLLEKGRRSCYKLKLCHLLLISKGAQLLHISLAEPLLFIISKLNVALLVFFVRMAWCLQLHLWLGRVEVNEADFDSSLPSHRLQSVECPVFKFQRSA